MKRKIYLILLFMILGAYSQDAFAASGMGTGPPAPPCGQAPFPPCPIPIDGGLAFLAGAGMLLGGKKLMTSLKKDPGN